MRAAFQRWPSRCTRTKSPRRRSVSKAATDARPPSLAARLHRQALAPLGAAPLQHLAAGRVRHALAEAVGALAAEVVRLVGPLRFSHLLFPLNMCRRTAGRTLRTLIV